MAKQVVSTGTGGFSMEQYEQELDEIVAEVIPDYES